MASPLRLEHRSERENPDLLFGVCEGRAALLLIKQSEKIGIIQTESCTTVFIAALFIIARTWKQPKCPLTDEWIKKMCHIYTMEYYSAIKRNEIELFVVR